MEELEDADNAILRWELLCCCVLRGRAGGVAGGCVGATGTGMCLWAVWAGAGAHISRDWL